MKIEIIGCTGTGKSTLMNNVVDFQYGKQTEIISGNDFVLRQTHLSWLSHRTFQSIAINIIGLFWCFHARLKYQRLLDFAFRYLQQLSPSITFRERLKISRIMARNIGIHEFIESRDTAKLIVVIDEGTLHIAHYLFVHESIEPDLKQLQRFVELVPCVDVVVHLRSSIDTLIERTQVRGHKRITEGSAASIKSFIEHAITTFNFLESSPEISQKMLAINPDGQASMVQRQEHSSIIETARRIILASLVTMQA